MYAIFLDIQKAYDSVWHDGFRYKLWGIVVQGRGCGVKSRKCMRSSKSAVLLEREKSDAYRVKQGVA